MVTTVYYLHINICYMLMYINRLSPKMGVENND